MERMNTLFHSTARLGKGQCYKTSSARNGLDEYSEYKFDCRVKLAEVGLEFHVETPHN